LRENFPKKVIFSTGKSLIQQQQASMAVSVYPWLHCVPKLELRTPMMKSPHLAFFY